ncbi:hypothetical protein GCK32_011989, partial [Trichostrongylus colubriformis]
RSWINILCVRRPTLWINDGATLQVLGSITHIAFIHDPVNLLGIPDIIYGLYQQMLTTWRESSRGLLSMFTAEQAPPPLIASNMRKYCFARRFLDSAAAESTLSSCRKVLTETEDPKGLAKAVNGWLFCSHEVTRKGFDFSVFDLDYLLQLILADDKNIWLDFVDTSKLTQEEQQEEKLFSLTCHLGPREPSQHVSDHFLNKPRNSRAIGFPVLPAHPCLPPAPVVDMSAIFQVNTVMEMVNPLIKHIRTIAEDYVVGGEKMAREDAKYSDLVTKLHAPVMTQVPVQLRCGIRCANPFNTAVQVFTTKFNEATDAQMAQSRENRSSILGELHTGVLDRAAVASATMEHIARQLARLSVLCSPSHRAGVQMTGRAMLKTAFTPECLSSTELCSAYTRLSEAVRNPERSSRALKLLRRLGMDKAAASLPPQQFAPLLPLAFRNLALPVLSQPDSNALQALHIL